jgi:hypothetical protein
MLTGYAGLVAQSVPGTEFGYDDYAHSHDELRHNWKMGGYRWFSSYTDPPVGWNPIQQLLDAGLDYVVNSAGNVTNLAPA